MTARPAAPDWELWGVFSVADHLRRRSFVADVLIYDKLIVPVPAEREGELWRKWERRWDPARQAELLGVIEAELPGLVSPVPWTAHHDRQWRRHAERDGLRLGLANATSRDVDIIQAVDRAADPDSAGQLAERDYLVNFVDPKQDKGIRSGVPPGEIDVVAAYSSHRRFARDVPVEEATGASTDMTLLGAFAWPLMVPSSSERSDVDLLKEAAELATRDETRAYRRAYHTWRRSLLAGTSSDAAAEELIELIGRYRASTRRGKIRTRVRMAALVLAAGAGGAVGALGDLETIVATEAGLAGAEQFLEARVLRTSVPEYQFAGALFHEARERFGWY